MENESVKIINEITCMESSEKGRCEWLRADGSVDFHMITPSNIGLKQSVLNEMDVSYYSIRDI